MTLLTGAHPDTVKARAADFDFVHAETQSRGLGSLILQPILWVRNQRQFPSCVGHAVVSCIEGARMGKSGARLKLSAVSIWREARRRQGRIERITEGTRIEYALEGLVKRGPDPYREGEDRDDFEAGAQDDLADELFADDKRFGNFRRWRIKRNASRLEQIEQALASPTFGVVVGMYLREGLFSVQDSAGPLGADLFGGGRNSHAMRVFGCRRRGGRREFALQNSWGGGWGGIWIESNGERLFRPGCVWVDEKVLSGSDYTHDVHCIEVLK